MNLGVLFVSEVEKRIEEFTVVCLLFSEPSICDDGEWHQVEGDGVLQLSLLHLHFNQMHLSNAIHLSSYSI